MSAELPDLSEVTPVVFDADTQETFDVEIRLEEALKKWFAKAGVDRTLLELGELGYRFEYSHHETVGGNLVVYKSPLPGGDRFLTVGWDEGLSRVVTGSHATPETRAALEEERRASLTADEQAKARVQDQFYDLGSKLFGDKYDEWDGLPEADRCLLAVYVAETGIEGLFRVDSRTAASRSAVTEGPRRPADAHRPESQLDVSGMDARHEPGEDRRCVCKLGRRLVWDHDKCVIQGRP